MNISEVMKMLHKLKSLCLSCRQKSLQESQSKEHLMLSVRSYNFYIIFYLENGFYKLSFAFLVAIGSLAGLFLGASLLSVLEFVHFIFFRPLLRR